MRSVIQRPLLRRFFESPSQQLVLGAGVIALAVVALFFHGEQNRYRESVERAGRDTRNAANLLAEHAGRTFDSIDETLRAVGRLRDDAARGIYRSRDSIYVHLKTLRGGSQVLGELGWFDAYGEQVATSDRLDPPRINATEQEFFRVQQEGSADRGLHVAAPRKPAGVPGWRIAVSRRLENLDGSFGGVAAGAIDPEAFTAVYSTLDLGPGYRAVLLRRDGAVLAHVPATEALLGKSLTGSRMTHDQLAAASAGTYERDAGPDGPARIGSYAIVPRTRDRLIVDVSVPRDVALAEFRRDFVADGMLAAFALTVLLAGTSAIVAGLRRRERLQAELATATDAAVHAQTAAQRAQAAAEKANRAKSEFLARMSHELRTPLNAVIGFAQMLELDPSRTLTQRQYEYSRHIREAGEHVLSLVNEILDLAGVESGRLSLSIERVIVADVLRGVGDILAPVAAKAGVNLEVEPTDDVPDVSADVQRLRQVLINLAANAIKYNRTGGCVTLSAALLPQGRVRIAVTDTGIGIPAERRKDLFEPFHRLGAEYTDIEGTGLGLAVTKRLVHAMGGAIDCESVPGVGSTFWVDFALADQEPVQPALQAIVPPASMGKAFKLLYIEDNAVNRRLMEHVAASLLPRATIVSAPTPQLGLELAQAHRPDVIVLDINLPGMDGYTVLDRLKSMPKTCAIPVLALSAAALPRDVERGMALGFFRYLTKPLDIGKLLAALDEALESREGSDVPVAAAS